MCCGRSSKTASPARTTARVSNTPLVGDAALRTVQWRWKGLAPADINDGDPLLEGAKVESPTSIVFPNEPAVKAWVDAGHPGTKTVFAV